MILVEGNMDVISLHQAGFENVVAPLGTAFTPEQANLIARYTKEIILMLDADAAGQKAIKRAEEILRNTGLSVRVVSIPNGKDPDEYIKTQGPERFKALLEGAVSNMEYKLLMAAQGLDLSNDDGRLKYLSLAAEIIASSDNVMERDIYIGRLCEKYGVSRTALSTKVDELRKKNIRAVKNIYYNFIFINFEFRIFKKTVRSSYVFLHCSDKLRRALNRKRAYRV
jgi:DNA primase